MALRRALVDPASRITRLVRGQEARFQAVFLRAIREIRDAHTLTALADLLAQGRLEEALSALDLAAAQLGTAYGESLSTSARDTARVLSSALTVTVSFDVTNRRAVDIMSQSTLRLVREFTAEQRQATRDALTEGIRRGANPREQARAFRESIGLTRRQVAAVNNYRNLLHGRQDGTPSLGALDRRLRDARFDRTVARAVREGEPLSARQVETMVSRYRDRMFRYRSETIARTEALRSVHQGAEEMYQQAIDLGQVDAGKLTRTWTTAHDDRVRGSHVLLDGQDRRIGETWQGATGDLRYPGDPAAPAEETVQCRCVLATRVEP